TIEVVIDRLLVKPGIDQRLEMSVGLAMKLAGGLVQVAVVGGEEQLFSARLACPDCGINVPQLEPRSFSFNSAYGACPECHGLGSKYDFDPAKLINDWSKPLLEGGLGPGSASQNLIHQLQIVAAAYGFDLATKIKLSDREEIIAERIVHEIVERLQFLDAVGLGYISLARSADTLSGGEGQRIRLATQIGSKLRGVLYVLDEPSIGLHHRDNGRLLKALEELRDLGNTVLVVEHDEETIRRADYVIDLGPGAGRHGGALV